MGALHAAVAATSVDSLGLGESESAEAAYLADIGLVATQQPSVELGGWRSRRARFRAVGPGKLLAASQLLAI